MHQYLFITAASVALCVPALPAQASPMRWNYTVTGLEAHQFVSWPEPSSSTYIANATGFFDADDLDHDGTITIDEVREIEPLQGIVYTDSVRDLISFSFSPDTGLSYVMAGYRYGIEFGVEASRISDTVSTTFYWIPSTVTTVSAPVPIVPEPGLPLLVLAAAWPMAWMVYRANTRRQK